MASWCLKTIHFLFLTLSHGTLFALKLIFQTKVDLPFTAPTCHRQEWTLVERPSIASQDWAMILNSKGWNLWSWHLGWAPSCEWRWQPLCHRGSHRSKAFLYFSSLEKFARTHLENLACCNSSKPSATLEFFLTQLALETKFFEEIRAIPSLSSAGSDQQLSEFDSYIKLGTHLIIHSSGRSEFPPTGSSFSPKMYGSLKIRSSWLAKNLKTSWSSYLNFHLSSLSRWRLDASGFG